MTPEERYDRMERMMEFLMEDAKTRNRDIEALIESTESLRTTVGALDSHMAKLTDTMDRLANIVIRHEERLDAMDGGDQQP